MIPIAIDFPLAIELDGLVDLFGDLRTPLMVMAVMLAGWIGVAVWVHLVSPVGRRIHKRAGR